MFWLVDKPDKALEALLFGLQQELLTKLITISAVHTGAAEIEENLILSQSVLD
jgi:hypothetical protein